MIKRRAPFLDFDGVLHATHGRADVMREFVWLPILLKLIEHHQDVYLVVHASARRTSSAEFIGTRLELSHAGQVRSLGFDPGVACRAPCG